MLAVTAHINLEEEDEYDFMNDVTQTNNGLYFI